MQPAPSPSAGSLQITAIANRIAAVSKRLEAKEDSRAIFAVAYVLLTRRLALELDRIGFSDTAWIVHLVEVFSDRFFVAMEAWDTGRDVPEGWQYVLEQITAKRTSVLEDLILGMAAHIVYDLPFAVLKATGDVAAFPARLADYHLMNDVLALEIDPIQKEISRRYNPFLHWLDTFLRKDDEILTNYGIRLSRGMAWYNAQRLADPVLSADAAKALARSPEVIAKEMLDPPRLRWAVRLLRWVSSFFRRWPRAWYT